MEMLPKTTETGPTKISQNQLQLPHDVSALPPPNVLFPLARPSFLRHIRSVICSTTITLKLLHLITTAPSKQTGMSFANYDIEAQSPPKTETHAESELDAIIRNTSDQIQTFGLLISQFNALRKLVGSKRDGLPLREKLDNLQNEVSELDSAIHALIMNVGKVMNSSQKKGKIDVSNRQMMLKERLVSEFHELHNNFYSYVKLYEEKKDAYAVRAPDETTPLIQESQASQQQVQVQREDVNATELQYHLMLTEERNREISQVAEGIREVNSIFKDLGALVNQQGEQLDTIEDNILQLHGNTQQASRELTKAHEYQKRRGKWSCILLVALCIFVLVVVLAVLG